MRAGLRCIVITYTAEHRAHLHNAANHVSDLAFRNVLHCMNFHVDSKPVLGLLESSTHSSTASSSVPIGRDGVCQRVGSRSATSPGAETGWRRLTAPVPVCCRQRGGWQGAARDGGALPHLPGPLSGHVHPAAAQRDAGGRRRPAGGRLHHALRVPSRQQKLPLTARRLTVSRVPSGQQEQLTEQQELGLQELGQQELPLIARRRPVVSRTCGGFAAVSCAQRCAKWRKSGDSIAAGSRGVGWRVLVGL